MVYAVSDLHGRYDLYTKLLEKINFSDKDTLYILGDISDRGPNPIDIFLDVLNRPNVRFILGNHDDRFCECIEDRDFKSHSQAILIAKENIHFKYWLYDGGASTAKQYGKLDKEDKEKIKSYLKNAPLFERIKVNGTDFFLSHAVPQKDKFDRILMMDNNGSLSHEIRYTNEFTWGVQEYDKQYLKNGYVVTGHNPTVYISGGTLGKIYKGMNNIAIDCGAYDTGILGCICLDNLEEIYVKKEN